MKILITGSNGFIGNHLIQALSKNNHSVILYDKKMGNDVHDINLLSRAFSIKPDLVIHLAAQSLLRKSIEDPISDAYDNIIGSINVLEMCKQYGIDKIIYASTGGAKYGNDYSMLIKETYHENPISPYGISKHTVEHYLKYYHREYGLEYSILCFGNVYGEYDPIENQRIITKTIYYNLTNQILEIYGDGSQRRDFIYVHDLVDFIVTNLNHPNMYSTVFNIGTGDMHSVNDVIDIVNEVSGKETKIRYLSSIKSEVHHVGLNVEKVKSMLGWKSKTNLYQGIKKTYDWFKKSNK